MESNKDVNKTSPKKFNKKIIVSAVVVAGILITILFKSGFIGTDASGHYTADSIQKITGRDSLSERDYSIGNVNCKNYWYSGRKEKDTDSLDFYLFSSSNKAKKAFKYMSENWFDSDSEITENEIKGILLNVCDAEIEGYAYLSGNMIVTANLTVSSGWGTAEDPVIHKAAAGNDDNNHIIQVIKDSCKNQQ